MAATSPSALYSRQASRVDDVSFLRSCFINTLVGSIDISFYSVPFIQPFLVQSIKSSWEGEVCESHIVFKRQAQNSCLKTQHGQSTSRAFFQKGFQTRLQGSWACGLRRPPGCCASFRSSFWRTGTRRWDGAGDLLFTCHGLTAE